jgi:hypothetical protein
MIQIQMTLYAYKNKNVSRPSLMMQNLMKMIYLTNYLPIIAE